jgi:hypothetical protein
MGFRVTILTDWIFPSAAARCVKADERTGRHHDLTAILPGEFDEILVLKKRTRAEDDRGLPAAHERRDDRSNELAGRALDHDVCSGAEIIEREDGGRSFQRGQKPLVLGRVLYRHSGEHQPVDALVQGLDDLSRSGQGHRHAP